MSDPEAPRPAIQFVFALHNHQPVGNFDFVFSEAYEQAYEPFLGVLEAYPGFRACLHHTGPLLLWIAENRPEYIDRLRVLVDRGQVELLGGAFYEPILPVIPEEDRLGQILGMSDWLEAEFGVRPRGMWLAERVWEPTLPRDLARAGIEYTVLDDSHFRAAGFDEQQCLGYYLTEDLGATVAVFPINERIRQQIPYSDPSETIGALRSFARPDAAPVAVMADDGEKFGVWPGSNRHCYGEGYMYRLAEMIHNNGDWIRMKTFSEVLDETQPLGRAYLPAASYVEMMEWALPPDSILAYQDVVADLKERDAWERARVFVRGGFWRSFLSKYPESNHLHKRMLRASRKLATAPDPVQDSPAWVAARDHLWRSQCNCAYWHGVFGGLYLPHLRSALYRHLIAAETIVDGLVRGPAGWIEFEAEDFDSDGGVELFAETPWQTLVLKPHEGGMLAEHDLRGPEFNLLDTLMRRREAYHADVGGGGDGRLEGLLVQDAWRRGALIDHFLGDDATPATLRDGECEELGDFPLAPYACEWSRQDDGRAVARLWREGVVHGPAGDVPVLVEKTISFDADSPAMEIRYVVQNDGAAALDTRFGVEFNVNLLAGSAHDRAHEVDGRDLGADGRLVSIGAIPDVRRFALIDGWQKFRVEWSLDRPAEHWRLPIETAANSVYGVERLYQGTVVMPVWRLEIPPGGAFEASIRYGVRCFD